MTPLERAERALGEALCLHLSDIDGSNEDVVMRNAVRAVLTAIREPSEGMKRAGAAAMSDWEGNDEPDSRVGATAILGAMIDAALAEEG